jgi:CotH kinase protein
MLRSYAQCAVVLLASFPVRAQLAGDELFDTDQVIELRITFSEDDYWLQLNTNFQADNGISLSAAVSAIDLSGTYALDSVAVKLKGNSSFDLYPTSKKPMKLDFNANVNGQDYHGLKKLNLNNCWSDPTFLREKVFMDVCRREGVLAPRMVFANVYLNNVYWGLYGVVEQVDKTFLDRWLGDSQGNLFKAGDNYTPDGDGVGEEADLNYYGASATNYTGRYELKTNGTQNDWTDLIELLDLIDNSTTSNLVAALPERFELDQLLRSLALDNLFGNMDAYYGTARNYYLYHDSTTLKWNWIHWDANMAFGRYQPQWVNDVAALPATYTSPGRRLLQRVMSNATLRQAYLNQYCDLFARFTNAELDPRINTLRDLIQPYVYADLNKEYADVYFDQNVEQTVTAQSGGFWNTIPGLKSFIAERRASLLASTLDCTTAGIVEEQALALSASPNPTSGLVRIGLPPGAVWGDIRVTDATGRSVPAVLGELGVDLSALPAGGYVLRVPLPEGEARAFVMKQ